MHYRPIHFSIEIDENSISRFLAPEDVEIIDSENIGKVIVIFKVNEYKDKDYAFFFVVKGDSTIGFSTEMRDSLLGLNIQKTPLSLKSGDSYIAYSYKLIAKHLLKWYDIFRKLTV